MPSLKKLAICLFFSLLIVPAINAKEAKQELRNVGEAISPAEDLMREHGVLRRVILIYEEVLRRYYKGKEIPADALASAARIIQTFIEQYHEKLEEDYIFPRFEKTGELGDLTRVLRKQHVAGRILTQKIINLSNATSLKEQKNRIELASCLSKFIRLYRPHAAREDTVLFPALEKVITPSELAMLGDKFEDKEQELFGKNGFEKEVERVKELEKTLGIYDLMQFIPK